jgi:predicted ferric reductase
MNEFLQSGALWYASRATGLVSLVLLTGVVLLGILTTSSGRLPGLPRFAVTDLHRNLSLLSVAFLSVHVASVVTDPYVTIRWTQVLIPWGGSYRPFFVGLGTVALDLILALILTSLARVRLGRRVWRSIHWLAYAAWPVAVVHGLGAGSDLGTGWWLGITLALVGGVAAATVWRGSTLLRATPRAGRVERVLRNPQGRAAPPARARSGDQLTTGLRR